MVSGWSFRILLQDKIDGSESASARPTPGPVFSANVTNGRIPIIGLIFKTHQWLNMKSPAAI